MKKFLQPSQDRAADLPKIRWQLVFAPTLLNKIAMEQKIQVAPKITLLMAPKLHISAE
jgi:hypothetical protein